MEYKVYILSNKNDRVMVELVCAWLNCNTDWEIQTILDMNTNRINHAMESISKSDLLITLNLDGPNEWVIVGSAYNHNIPILAYTYNKRDVQFPGDIHVCGFNNTTTLIEMANLLLKDKPGPAGES